jgi:hypothetical protein
MLTTAYLEKKLKYVKPEFLDIIFELRNLVVSVAPQATEVFQRNGLSYYFGEKGGPLTAGICKIGIKEDHIRLIFLHGAFLPDPLHLLRGNQIAMRYIKITSFQHAPWEELQKLIDLSSRFDPYTQKIVE